MRSLLVAGILVSDLSAIVCLDESVGGYGRGIDEDLIERDAGLLEKSFFDVELFLLERIDEPVDLLSCESTRPNFIPLGLSSVGDALEFRQRFLEGIQPLAIWQICLGDVGYVRNANEDRPDASKFRPDEPTRNGGVRKDRKADGKASVNTFGLLEETL